MFIIYKKIEDLLFIIYKKIVDSRLLGSLVNYAMLIYDYLITQQNRTRVK
jgi:hypothetical protein